MSKHSRFVFMSGVLLFMLLVSLACPVTVYADDGTPPLPATEDPVGPTAGEAVQPPAEGDGAAEVMGSEADSGLPIAAEESVAPVTAEEPVATETPVEADGGSPIVESEAQESGEEVTMGEVLAAASEDTKVVVLDQSGEALPLVSVEALEIVATVDPIWCPGTQSPTPLLNGCTDSYNTVTDLIANLGGKSGAGTIYFTSTYSPAIPDATFDHTNANLANLTDLTIQGGWNGSTGAAYALSGVTTFNGPLWITNWNGNVTLNDLALGSAPGMTGLMAQTSGEIELNGVEANSNTMGNGASLTSGGDIHIADSTFNKNGLMGLTANSQNGSITLNDVEAGGNAMGNGASLTASGDVQVTSSRFNGNSSMGLSASSTHGRITLNDVDANYNTSAMPFSLGASLSAGGDIQVTSSTFDYNGVMGGLNASSANGSITLHNVEASHNKGSLFFGGVLGIGASLGAGGDIHITSGRFEDNGIAGLFAPSTSGSVILNDVIASENGDAGALIATNSYIEITNSTFNANLGTQVGNSGGLLALSLNDAIRLERVTANDNNALGLYVEALGDISLADVTTSRNGLSGAYITSPGAVFLSGVSASSNGNVPGSAGGDGAQIYDFSSLTIEDSAFDNNYANTSDGDFGYGWGLFASGWGTVTLTNVTASGNYNPDYYAGGAYIDTDGDIIIDPSEFNNNTNGAGLDLWSGGNITLTDVTANGNGDEGARLLSEGDASLVCSQFTNNGGIGVDGYFVNGAFTLNDVTFGSNDSGDYDGSPIITSGGCKVVVDPGNPIMPGSGTDVSGADDKSTKRVLPLHIVPVSGGEQVYLDCGPYSGTKLILPNSDQVTLPCPIHDHGVLTGKMATQLPAPLNAPFAFASALDVQVIRNGEAVSKVNVAMIVDFVIPDSMQGKDFAILRWDVEKSQWVEVPGGAKTGDGRFMAASTFTGIYVLVTK